MSKTHVNHSHVVVDLEKILQCGSAESQTAKNQTSWRHRERILRWTQSIMYQSIETPAPRPPGLGGEFNIYPVLKDGLFPPAPGLRDLLKAPHSGASTHRNQMKKHLTFTDKKKIAYNHSDPGGTLEKFSKLKPFISCNEGLYISKEVKEKTLLHQRANHADHKQWPQKINVCVTTSQCEISGKNHIWSVKTFSSRA